MKLFGKDDGWYADMKKKDFVKKDQDGKVVATEKWTSKVNDPVKSRINL